MTFLRCWAYALAALTVGSFYSSFSRAEDQLSIRGFPPTLPIEIAGDDWFIFLEGVIDHDAPRRFETYLQTNKVPPRSLVILNSPGGDLLAGIQLGRLFRQYGLTTDVGVKPPNTPQRFNVLPGGCFSSCSYAYLGGVFRYMQKDSKYGVHRFARRTTDASDSDVAQIASALIVEYLSAMGINPALFKASVVASPAEMNELSRETLEQLSVVNNGITKPTWTIESVAQRLYFKGEHDSCLRPKQIYGYVRAWTTAALRYIRHIGTCA